MRKHLAFALIMLFLLSTSCDDETPVSNDAEPKITMTDIHHETGVQELLSKIKAGSANGRVSSLEVDGAFFKYEDLDSGILNYTFLLPDDSPDYFENLILSKYDDGFYGYIYRYIPDENYTRNEPFRGVLQQFDLNGNPIAKFTIPFEYDSVYAGGRIQLLNQCIKSIEQTCVTTYEVETVTDYPCHCQYDRKTEVSKVCTFSFKMGWCDDMATAPAAGGGGTYVGSAASSPSPKGGGGNNTGTTKPAPKKPVVLLPDNDMYVGDKCVACIENYLKDPCLKMVANKVLDPTLASTFNNLIQDIFNKNDKVNLILKESDKYDNAFGWTPERPDVSNGIMNITIYLNPKKLAEAPAELTAATIYHEAFHAVILYFDADANFTPTDHHIILYDKYLKLLAEALGKAYPTLPPKDAAGLILSGAVVTGQGSIKAANPELAKLIIARKGFDEAELITILDRYKKRISGTPCK